MYTFLITLILFSVYLPQSQGELQHDNSLTPAYSTGNCKTAHKLQFIKVCNTSISYALERQWRDERAPAGTNYIIFKSKFEADAIFVSFGQSPLFDCRLLVINSKDNSVMAKRGLKTYYEYVSVPAHSDTHCLNESISYVAALLANCQRRPFRDNEEYKHPILHYSRYKLAEDRASNLIESIWLILLAITLLGASDI